MAPTTRKPITEFIPGLETSCIHLQALNSSDVPRWEGLCIDCQHDLANSLKWFAHLMEQHRMLKEKIEEIRQSTIPLIVFGDPE